jgi:hypothetical protein
VLSLNGHSFLWCFQTRLLEELNDFPKVEDPDQEFEFELFGGEY